MIKPYFLLQSKKKNLISSLYTGKNKDKKSKVKGSTVPSPELPKSKEAGSGGNSDKLSTPSECRTVALPGARRTRVPDRPNCSLNLWSIMKNCIGKELSKIPMPVSQNKFS